MNAGNSTQVWARPRTRIFAPDDTGRVPSPLIEQWQLRCSVSGLFLVPCSCKQVITPAPFGLDNGIFSFMCWHLWSCECHMKAAMKHANALRIRVFVSHTTLLAWLVADGYWDASCAGQASGAWRCQISLTPRIRMSGAIPPLPHTF